MQRISNGDSNAFQILFDRHSSLLLGYARRLMGDLPKAEDISQEVWIKVVRAASTYQDQKKFSSWILGITRNTCLNQIRDTSDTGVTDNISDHEIVDSNEDLLQDLLKKETTTQIQKAIDQLPIGQKQALLLWLYEDLSYEEISHQLSLTLAAAKSILFRAKESLISHLRGQI